MKAGLLVGGNGALMYLTSHQKYIDDSLIEQFKAKGISKFIDYEVPVELAKEKYGSHFDIVMHDLKETDDLRILDYDGARAFKMFNLKQLGSPLIVE
jgi:hypothetical protein